MPTAELISATHEPLELLKKAAGQCYQREATDATIKHIIEAGHLSVLEHAYASFEVSCSLTVLLQLTAPAFVFYRAEQPGDTFG